MPSFHRTVFLGHDLALFLPDPDWKQALAITYRLQAEVEVGQTGRENRWPRYSWLRHKIAARWLLPRAETAELQQALYDLGSPAAGERVYVGMPLFADRLTPAEWADRIHTAEWVINYDATGYSLHAANAVPAEPARQWLAPLVVGRLESRPVLKALNQDESDFSLRLLERSPWDFRIAPAAEAGVGADWPASLTANWRELPEDSTEDTLIYEDVGDGRVEALDGQEGVVRRRQRFLLTLENRSQIRTLLNFFLARKGRVQSFTAPWLLQPGDDTPATPWSTKARFADDEITLNYANQDQADVKVFFAQVPWEVAGVEGETPEQEAEAFFYKFWLDVPGDPVAWRYTNREQDLVRAGDGTYLGGFFSHDKISQSIDLSDEPTTLRSWIFTGNPLLLVMQRSLDLPLHVEIRRGTPANPDAAALIYEGTVEQVPDEGRRLSATTAVLGGLLDMKLPAVEFGPSCKYELCGPGCNQIDGAHPGGSMPPEDWTFAGTIAAVAGNDVTVTVTANPPAAALVDDWFAKGWFKKGSGGDYELRSIVRSVDLGGGSQKFTLKRPLRAFTVGEVVTFRPYCSGTRTECETKFDNYINFGGDPHIGPRNLSVPAREVSTPTAKK